MRASPSPRGTLAALCRPRSRHDRQQDRRGRFARPRRRGDAVPDAGHPRARDAREGGQGAQERPERLLRSQPLHQLDQRLLRELPVLLVRAVRQGRGQGSHVGRRGRRKGARDRDELQPDPHRGRTRPASALPRLLAAVDAPLQATVAARAALAVHGRGDRLSRAPAPALVRRDLRRSCAQRASTTSTAAAPKSSASVSAARCVRTRSTQRIGSRSTRRCTATASPRTRRCSTARSRRWRSASSI